ncbi:hypothetical protein L207DRAFT_562610 [Hyaloscypha variabilis F]|uniref:Uncharacterized protein n=1 Tax=Hyaloscypha variabilis (strain UAMH 11265 / GT02V1 / F) TaxID=1149755 RepID=A0A2J6S3T0_HYAVF|nr:hypothetical protein L207DRAFT_562610 [Hyaloscypha variabilis F]
MPRHEIGGLGKTEAFSSAHVQLPGNRCYLTITKPTELSKRVSNASQKVAGLKRVVRRTWTQSKSDNITVDVLWSERKSQVAFVTDVQGSQPRTDAARLIAMGGGVSGCLVGVGRAAMSLVGGVHTNVLVHERLGTRKEDLALKLTHPQTQTNDLFQLGLQVEFANFKKRKVPSDSISAASGTAV